LIILDFFFYNLSDFLNFKQTNRTEWVQLYLRTSACASNASCQGICKPTGRRAKIIHQWTLTR